MEQKKTESWQKYENGLNFFRKDRYFPKVAKAERFYSNDHWHGMDAVDLPKPIFPMSKRIIDFKVSSIMAEDIKMNFSVEGYAEGTESEQSELYDEAAEVFTQYSETTWEEVNQKALNEEMLLNAALSGPGILHYYLDADYESGNDFKAIGRICGEVIDGINLFLGNPNDRRINAHGKAIQPYVIISYRELVSKAKEDAKKNEVPQDKIDLIAADSDSNDQVFDKAQQELDDQSKTTVLLHYWKKDGTIWMKKSTKGVQIVKDTDTEKKLYPIVLMNWDLRKRFAYGMGEMEGQIPNQIAVNTLFAMAILSAQRTGVPKAIYDSTRINGWSNAIGKAVGVNGPISDVFKYAETGNMSIDIYKLIDLIISYTKELAGANENALGEAKADNTSALMWAQKQSAIPLEGAKRRFMQAMHDAGKIWSEFWQVNFNTTRAIGVKNQAGDDEVKMFHGSKYKDIRMNLKLDIGASSQWSEVFNLNTLNSWLDKDRVTFIEYLERLPQGLVAKKQQLIDSRKEQEEDKELLFGLMARFVDGLPPEIQMQLEALLQENPEEYEKQVKEMIMQTMAQEEQAKGMPMDPQGMPQEPMAQEPIPQEIPQEMLSQGQ